MRLARGQFSYFAVFGSIDWQILNLTGVEFDTRGCTDPMYEYAQQNCDDYAQHDEFLTGEGGFLLQIDQTEHDGCQPARTKPTHKNNRGRL